jgi:hypothetical protein
MPLLHLLQVNHQLLDRMDVRRCRKLTTYSWMVWICGVAAS